MTDTLILTKDDYLDWTDVSINIPPKSVDRATRIGQRKYLKLVLGEDLYNKIIDEVENIPSEPYESLIKSFIKPFLAISCYSDLLAYGVVQSSATGPKNISDNENGQTDVNQSALGISIRQNNNTATEFKSELIKYLEDNSDLFPEYTSSTNCPSKNTTSAIPFMQVKRRYYD